LKIFSNRFFNTFLIEEELPFHLQLISTPDIFPGPAKPLLLETTDAAEDECFSPVGFTRQNAILTFAVFSPKRHFYKIFFFFSFYFVQGADTGFEICYLFFFFNQWILCYKKTPKNINFHINKNINIFKKVGYAYLSCVITPGIPGEIHTTKYYFRNYIISFILYSAYFPFGLPYLTSNQYAYQYHTSVDKTLGGYK